MLKSQSERVPGKQTTEKQWSLGAPFETERGAEIDGLTVAYRTWGTLNDDGSNAVFVGHALTGTPDAESWWPGLIGGGRVLDPARHFIVCANVLGGCYGTTGPATLDESGQRLGSRYPQVTVRDMARVHALLLDALGVRVVQLGIGGSLGGMQALELALARNATAGVRVERLVLIGMGARHGAWQIGISEAQRLAIRADGRWNGGDFAPAAPPSDGLAAARAIGMMTYRTPGQFEDRFGRNLQPERSDRLFAVQSYLRYQGEKLANRFDAGSYVRLTEAMDDFDIQRDREPAEIARMSAPALCVGVTTDALYPSSMSSELADILPNGRYAELDSPFGHDAFLIDFGELSALLLPFLEDTGFFQ